ncbi:hypothetical protein L2734_18790 [Parashewanella spongiae]|uniref:hypothetical protein n=1 Tax=Parashewanella spongiae TaxID=342950 RepID=UPI0010592A99|nr:hypothetical protein [Parashewanella spongiae]MCL1080175.1 hypothetical protein [Parashewanella spongiae]
MNLSTKPQQPLMPSLDCRLEEEQPTTQSVTFPIEPLFRTRKQMLHYCFRQLNSKEKETYTKLLEGNEVILSAVKLATCSLENKCLIKPYCLFLMETKVNYNFSQAARAINDVGINNHLRQDRPFSSEFLQNLFFTGAISEIHSLTYVYERFLGKLAEYCQTKEGETEVARRHLVSYLLDTKHPNDAVRAINRLKTINNPYTKEQVWRIYHMEHLLGLLDIEELIYQLRATGHKDSNSTEKVFFLANQGDKVALERYILFYREEKHLHNGKIASKLSGNVNIPKLKRNRNWKAHMVEQFLLHKSVTIEEPEWYKELVLSAKLTHLEEAPTLVKRKRNIKKLPSAVNPKKAKLALHKV